MNRSSFLMCIVLAGSIASTTIQAGCDVAAAFAIPAILTDSCLSKRTVEDARAQAQATIYYYENHLGVYTIEAIRKAYWVVRATDKQIENNLWWENKGVAALAGLCTAAVYGLIMYPEKRPSCYHSHVFWYSSPSYAAPYCR